MRKIALSISEIKDVEKREILRLGNSFKLMEQAGEACAKQIIKIYKKNRFIVACGPGNNGGDGLILSNCLSERGKDVDLYCLGKNNYKGDALKAYKRNKLKKKPLFELNTNQDAVIVDALFGIGLNKKVEGIFKECIDKINNSKLKVIAVDIPSGVYGDNGKTMGDAVRADVTLALHAKKLGHKMYPGSKLSGKIKIIDIGIDQ
jgi:NAD(P)H-hydrate epimerase|tara:strand:- start:1515 stop:2126 length:612 start_codon:yes stop_codon:yes gene_type:complete